MVTKAEEKDLKTGVKNPVVPKDEDVTPVSAPPVENTGLDDVEEVETEEEKIAREAKEKAIAEAVAAEEAEAQAAIEEQKRLEEEAKKSSGRSQGSEIASAIVEGLKATKEDKRIKIVADKSVKPRFSIVRSKQTGEVMIRENETNTLSKVQLESIEEKEASIQGTEVEEL